MSDVDHSSDEELSEVKTESDVLAPENAKLDTKTTKKRNYMLYWLTAGLLLIGILWLVYYLLYLQHHQFTDDAYANGNMININSAVTGSVIAFYADNTDLVTEGMLLAELDPTEYRIAFEKELALLAAVTLEVAQLYDRVLIAKSILENKQTLLAKAKYDYDNRLPLLDSRAISNEDIAHAKDEFNLAQSTFNQAEHELTLALDAAGKTLPEEHPKIVKQRAQVHTAYYQLMHCKIFAPTTGYIAQRTVEVGQWVTPGMNLMAIIPTDYVWVDANFKETELTYIRVGQPTTVWFDMYGSKVIYKGKVLGIGLGSGSVFSIIPPQNATGNWIKIVQRLPVRISLDPNIVSDYPIRLGISAQVNVDITNQDLPMLTTTPVNNKPIATTAVYNIDFKAINQIMDSIVKDNLNSHLLVYEQ